MDRGFPNYDLGDTDAEIHIGLAFDRNYLMPFYALITSLFSCHRSNELRIYAISPDVNQDERNAIQEYIRNKRGNPIQFYSIDETLVKKFQLSGNWTEAVYYRLFFPFLIPNVVRRLLYIDTDTIVTGSLHQLYNSDMEGYPLAAVYDSYVKTQPLIGIEIEGEYFNSGVLLIDKNVWLQQRISEKAMEYLVQYPERIRFVDQCALNAVLFNNWKKLAPSFNLIYSYVPQGISKTQLINFLKDVAIVHFTLQRPWNMLCTNRLGFLYHYYINKSPLGRKGKKYNDYSWKKFPQFLKIRLFNLYLDIPFLPNLWRKLKKIIPILE